MRLELISIKNFRCLKDVENIPFHNLTVLIGENDAGKSSILDALGIVLDKKKPSIEDYFIQEGQPRETEIIIELLLSYDADEEKPEQCYLTVDDKLLYRVRYTLQDTTVEVKGKRFSNSDLNNDFSKLKAGEFDELLNRLGITYEGRRNSEVRQQLVHDYIDKNNPDQVEAWVEVKNEVDKYLPRFEKYSTAEFKNPELMIQKTLQAVVESRIYELDDVSGEKVLILSLKEVKADIKEGLDTKIVELLGFVKRYNQRITGLSIDPIIDFTRGFQTGRLFLTDTTGSYHIDNKGEGTKKRLFMSILDWDRKIMLETDSRPVIRAYDEPDANLHYEAQRKMFYSLRDITYRDGSKIQAIICTHSLTMIDRAPAKNINLLLADDDDGQCYVKYLQTDNDDCINNFLCDMSRSMGISNTSIFYERCFIFVEGPTEENALPVLYNNLYNTSVVEDGIKLVNIEGCGGWENFVKLMGINKKDLMLFLLDADCNDEESSCSLNKDTLVNLGFEEDFIDNNVVYIGDKEFEDAFSSTVYVNVLNHHWKKVSGTDWTNSDIDSIRGTEKFSKSLIEEVWRESRLKGEQKCTKPKLGLEMAKYCHSRSDIPVEIINLFEKARNISGIV